MLCQVSVLYYIYSVDVWKKSSYESIKCMVVLLMLAEIQETVQIPGAELRLAQ